MQSITTTQKRAQLRAYARSINLCATCYRRDTVTNKNVCQKCADNNKRAQDKKRHTPGRCSRCGRINTSTTRKTCTKCRGYNTKRTKKLKSY